MQALASKIDLANSPSKTYIWVMYTIIETPTFKEDADKLWTEEERGAFCSYLAANPEVGEVIPRSGGCRKVRWSKAGTGKRGGVRVVYFTRLRTVKYGCW